MQCEKVKEILPAYEGDELSQSEATEVRAHLNECRLCQREKHLLSATWEMLDVLPRIEPSPDFRTRLWEKIKNEKTKRIQWQQTPRLAFAAGFLGLWVFGVGIGSLLFFKTGQMQKFHFASPRGERLMETESPSVDSVYLKRWGGIL